jgi:TM2 domain-containing membrane protein YozV
MVYCVNCGTELSDGWNVCPQCGAKRDSPPSSSNFSEDGQWYWNGNEWVPIEIHYRHPTIIPHTKKVKSKGLAYALNFLIPGLGNIYLGNNWAILFLIIWSLGAGPLYLAGEEAWCMFAILFLLVSSMQVHNDYLKYMRKIQN